MEGIILPGERITPEEFFARFARPTANENVAPATPNNPQNINRPVTYYPVPPTSTRMVYERDHQGFLESPQTLPLLLVGLGLVCTTIISIVAIFALTKR